jgi:hypothetical protein
MPKGSFMKSFLRHLVIAVMAYSFVAFAQVDTTTLANLSPEEIQTLVNNFSSEELAQMQSLCQQLFPDDASAPETAKQMDNGQVILGVCQAVATKLGGNDTATGQADNPLGAQQNTNPLQTTAQTTPAKDAGGLSGLYKYYDSSYEVNVDGSVVPNPPKYWYFFSDGYVYKGNLGHEAVNCASAPIEGCDSYTVSGDTISFGDGQSSVFTPSSDTLMIDDQEWIYVKPESFTLEGSYESTSGSSTFLNINTITFRDDSTFSFDGATGVVSSDTQTYGDTTATGGQTETTTTATGFGEDGQSGTYLIRDNNIILTYPDGKVETLTFDYSESPEEGVYGVYVGGTLYY